MIDVRGFLLCALSLALFCLMDAVVKGLGQHLSTFQIAFVRYAGAVVWLTTYIVFSRGAWPQRRNLGRHATRGALMMVTACLFFYGVSHLPLAIAAALGMSAPVYVSILGVVFLKERVRPVLLAAIGLGIAGSLVIVFGGGPVEVGGSSDALAWGAAILAPVTYAASIVLLKHHADTDTAPAMTLAQSVVAGLLALPLAVPGIAMPPQSVWPLMLLVGLLGAVAFLLLVTGIRRLSTSIYAVIDYSGLLWAALFGFVFFAEVPEPRFWIGGALIVVACALGMRAARAPSTVAAV